MREAQPLVPPVPVPVPANQQRRHKQQPVRPLRGAGGRGGADGGGGVAVGPDSLQLRRKNYDSDRSRRKRMTEAPAAVVAADASPKLQTRVFFALKGIQLVLSILNVGLAVDPLRVIPETDVVHACLALVAFSSAIIVSCVLIISRLAHEPTPPRATLLLLVVNGCLLVAAGGVLLADWCRLYYRIYNLQPKLFLDMMIACGVIAIFNAAAHFVDVGLTIALA